MAAQTSARSASTTVIRGSTRLNTDPAAIPPTLPRPAAPMTTASEKLVEWSPIGCSRSRNAMNRVRNPESQRGPQFARRAKAIVAGMRILPCEGSTVSGSWGRSPLRNPTRSSPRLESTRDGSRMASTVASTNTAAA